MQKKFDRFNELGKGVGLMANWSNSEIEEFAKLEKFTNEKFSRYNQLLEKISFENVTSDEVSEFYFLEKQFFGEWKFSFFSFENKFYFTFESTKKVTFETNHL